MIKVIILLFLISLIGCKEVTVIRPPTDPNVYNACSSEISGIKVAKLDSSGRICNISVCQDGYTLYEVQKIIDGNTRNSIVTPFPIMHLQSIYPKVCIPNDFGRCNNYVYNGGDIIYDNGYIKQEFKYNNGNIVVTNGRYYWASPTRNTYLWNSNILGNSVIEKALTILIKEGTPYELDYVNRPRTEISCHPIDEFSCGAGFEFYAGRFKHESLCLKICTSPTAVPYYSYDREGKLLFKECLEPQRCGNTIPHGTYYGYRYFNTTEERYGNCIRQVQCDFTYINMNNECVLDYCFIDPLSNECAAQTRN